MRLMGKLVNWGTKESVDQFTNLPNIEEQKTWQSL